MSEQVGSFGWNLRAAIGNGEAGKVRVELAELLGVDLDQVRVWINQGDHMLRIEVAK